MAKLYKQKARKEYVCNKCGSTINKGDEYYKVEAMYQRTKIRCIHCKPERSELTGSEYYSWLWDLQDHVAERYDLRSEEGRDELYSELENMRDELQDKLDNMPEQLQYASSGETLQERIDSIEDALNELDNAEFPDEDDYRVEEEDIEGLPEDEISDIIEDKKREYEDALDEYEQVLIDAVGNIE